MKDFFQRKNGYFLNLGTDLFSINERLYFLLMNGFFSIDELIFLNERTAFLLFLKFLEILSKFLCIF